VRVLGVLGSVEGVLGAEVYLFSVDSVAKLIFVCWRECNLAFVELKETRFLLSLFTELVCLK